MRYVDLHSGRVLVALLALAAAGCASVAPPPPAAPAAVAEAPVSADVQQAFDNAVRALAAGQVAQAESGFRALTVSNPELGGPHADLGLIYRQTGRLPEAVAALEQAVRASPKQPLYLNQLGLAYRQQGQFDQAREAYERALELAPDYAAAMLNLAILNDLYLGDGRRALALYERYLELSPQGDAQVSKWVLDLRNRKPQQLASSRKDAP